MRKFPFKRFLALGLIATLSFTLAACGKDNYNTSAPYGTITGDYATNGDVTLTNKQLYDLLRPNGYSLFYTQIEEILLKDYIDDLDYNDDKEEMSEYLNEVIFGTDDVEKIKNMSKSERDLVLEQLSDSMYLSNLELNVNDIKFDGEYIDYPVVLFDYFKLNLAKERFAVKALEAEIAKGEEYEEENEDGEMETITNPYFISDKNIETYYNNTYINNQEFNVIIAGFNTIAEAEAAWNSSTPVGGQGNDTLRKFLALYNKAYPYKTELTFIEQNLEGNYLTETLVDSTTLAGYNASLVSFINGLEANEYNSLYKQFGDKVYFVYRINKYADTEWKDLTDEKLDENDLTKGKTKEEIKDEIYQELFDAKLTDSFISIQMNKLIEELIEENKISIYDPVLAINFAANFTDFEYTTKELEDQNNVAKINGTEISAQSFFETLRDFYGVNTAYSYFTSHAVASSRYIDKLDEDDIKGAQTSFDAEIKKFKNNEYASYGITNVFTEEEFLSMMFGYDNEADVLTYHYESQAALKYIGTIHDDNYFELLELVAQNNYYNYYSLNIKHVLLFVDYDLDGTLDNPAEFMNKLSDEDQIAFKEAIINIYTAVYNEATYLDLGESAALDYIVKAYNQDKDFVSPENKEAFKEFGSEPKWSDIRGNFNIQMKVEDLGVVDTSTGSNYVTEFSTHVQNMYNDLKSAFKAEEGFVEGEDEEDKDFLTDFSEYLDQNHLEKITKTTNFNELCMSTFGFHMLLSTKGSTQSSSIFLAKNDYKENSDDEYKQYEHIFVELNGEEEYINAYSETHYPSLNQLKVYVYEKDTDDGIENIKSYTETIINSFYSSFNSRLTDQTFMSYYLYQELNMNVVFSEDAVIDGMEDNWFIINQKTLNSYKDDSMSLYAGMWDLVEEIYSRESN